MITGGNSPWSAAGIAAAAEPGSSCAGSPDTVPGLSAGWSPGLSAAGSSSVGSPEVPIGMLGVHASTGNPACVLAGASPAGACTVFRAPGVAGVLTEKSVASDPLSRYVSHPGTTMRCSAMPLDRPVFLGVINTARPSIDGVVAPPSLGVLHSTSSTTVKAGPHVRPGKAWLVLYTSRTWPAVAVMPAPNHCCATVGKYCTVCPPLTYWLATT